MHFYREFRFDRDEGYCLEVRLEAFGEGHTACEFGELLQIWVYILIDDLWTVPPIQNYRMVKTCMNCISKNPAT